LACQLDRNILARIADESHHMHPTAVEAVDSLVDSGETLFYLPQNIRGFWNVCTRPIERNGLGLSHTQVEAEVLRIEAAFSLLEDGGAVYREWRRLVLQHKVSGVQVHDCYIAAAMKVHGINRILTFNASDFSRYGLVVINPYSL